MESKRESQRVGRLYRPTRCWMLIFPFLILVSFCVGDCVAHTKQTKSEKLLVGGLSMLQAHWPPANLRPIHSLEILADELVYAGTLVVLFKRSGTIKILKATPAS